MSRILSLLSIGCILSGATTAHAQRNRLAPTANPAAVSGSDSLTPATESFGFVHPPVFLSSGGQPPHPAVVRITAPGRGSVSYGSGCLIAVNEQHGLVVTNWHVINEATGPITVDFPDGFESTASVQKVDKDWDLAALAIWRPRVAPAKLAGAAPRPGETLTIAGYGPGKYRAVSGECTQYVAPGERFPFEMVEVAVAARQGDSGGPIFNRQGELAGVLFGEGQGRTSGSYCGRVQWFLESVVGPGGLGPGRDIAPSVESPEMIAARPPQPRAVAPDPSGPRGTARTGQAIHALADLTSPQPQPPPLAQLPIVPIPPDALVGSDSSSDKTDTEVATLDPPVTSPAPFGTPGLGAWHPIGLSDQPSADGAHAFVANDAAAQGEVVARQEENSQSPDPVGSEPLVATVPMPNQELARDEIPSLTSRWDQIKAFLAVLSIVAFLLWIVRWLTVSGQESDADTDDEPSEPKNSKKKAA